MKKVKIKLRKVVVLLLALGVVVSSSLVYFYFSAHNADAAWYNNGWYHRIKLTIDHTKVTADQTDFPLYVDLSLLPSSLFSQSTATGGDIRVTKGDGTTEIPREVVNYNAAKRSGELHFKYTGTLSSTVDTNVYIYYGNAAATEPAANATYGKYNVWDSNYLAVYHLSETSGHHLDSTSNNKDSTAETSLVAQGSAQGKLGGADDFNGTSSQVSLPAIPLGGDNATIEAWVYPTVWDSSRSRSAVGRYYQSQSIQTDGATQKWATCMSPVASCAYYYTAFAKNVWYHLAATYDGSLGSANLINYVNGVNQATENGTGAIGNEAEIWKIGISSGTSSTSYWDGKVDEVRLSTNARSATWLSTQYNNQNSPSSFFTFNKSEEQKQAPILSLSFDEGYLTTAHDSSPNRYDGTLSGSTAPTWQGKEMCISEKCLYYNGTTAYVNVPTSNTMGQLSSSFSVSLWVKGSVFDSTYRRIISRNNNPSQSWYIENDGSNPGSLVYFGGGSGGQDSSDTILEANKWYHIEMVNDGAFSTLYINGNFESHVAVSGATSIVGDIGIGSDPNGSGGSWKGYIDEVRIYDYARTAAQVKADYAGFGNVKGAAVNFGSGQNTTLSQGLVGYWKMDENTGSSVVDSSGNGNTVTLTGMSGDWTYGKFGSTLQFSGAGHEAKLTQTFPTVTEGTIGAWIYSTSAGVNQTIFAAGDDAGTDRFIHFLVNSSNKLNLYVRLNTSSNEFDIATNATLTTNRWTHVLVTQSSLGPKLYIDGVEHATGGITRVGTANGMEFFDDVIGVDNTTIGYRDRNTNDSYFVGKIDDLRLYNRALTTAEVRQLYNWSPGPVVHLRLDENTGITANDSSGNGNTGTLTNSPVWGAGKYGTGLYFDPSTSNKSVIVPAATSINNLPQFTYSLWVNPSLLQDRDIFAKGANLNMYFENISSGLRTQMYIGCSGTGLSRYDTSDDNLSLNAWHHIAVTWDGQGCALTNVELYIDGVRSHQHVNSTAGSGTRLTDSGSNLYIGNGSGTSQIYGSMDDFKIYNYVRTPSQIVEDMNVQKSANNSPSIYWKLDEGFGATTYNSGIRAPAYNGALSGPVWKQEGQIGKAVHMATSTNYISGGAAYLLDRLTTLSTSFWINPQVLAVNKGILSRSNFSTQNHFAVVTDASNSQEIRIYIASGLTDSSNYFTTSGLGLTNGTWAHIGIVYNAFEAASSRIKVYKDGKQISGTVTGTIPTAMTDQSSALLKLGATDSGSYTALNAIYDEVKLYSGTLTQENFKTELNQGKSSVLGATSTGSDAKIASNSAGRAYCPPGNIEGNCAVGLNSSPIGEWKMDENTGQSLFDSSGNNYTGSVGTDFTVASDDPVWTVGKFGGALNFDGINDDVRVADNNLFSFGNATTDLPFTFETWVYPDNNISHYFFDKSGEYAMRLGTDGRLICSQQDNSTNGYIGRNYSLSIPINGWHHVVCTYDGSRTSAGTKIYLDGVQVDNANEASGSYVAMENTNNAIHLSDSTDPWLGKMDDVRMFNYVRTQAQIAWDYNKGAPVAQYKFDECLSATAYDASSNANGTANGGNGVITPGGSGNTAVGTCNSGVSTDMWNDGTTGKFNGSLGFDGLDDTVAVANRASNNFNGKTSITMSAWIKPISAGENSFGRVLDKDGAINGYQLWIASGGSVGFSIDTSTGDYLEVQTTTTPLAPFGSWHFITAHYDSISGVYKIFVDGKLQPVTVNHVGSGTIVDNGGILYLGNRAAGDRTFDGQLDDIRIYNYALSTAQINTVMNSGAVRFGQ